MYIILRSIIQHHTSILFSNSTSIPTFHQWQAASPTYQYILLTVFFEPLEHPRPPIFRLHVSPSTHGSEYDVSLVSSHRGYKIRLSLYRARLVSHGCSEGPNVGYTKNFAPVAKSTSLSIIFAIRRVPSPPCRYFRP
jgi:hypothetical protein